ncbi:MAG TPA: chromosomal replication initiator protein DnaA [Solirubrobacteraceae bacterium]|nr:chromosomal replication initiator protein DnaA [Solirubrobacteraceae bacterium]
MDQIWTRLQSELAAAVDEPTYRIWLEPLALHELTPTHIAIAAPPRSCGWIRERFGRLLQSCVATVLGNDVSVTVVAAQGDLPTDPSQQPPITPLSTPAAAVGAPLGNPRYTFDQFVIGDSNRLAHAAALTVAELPGQAYNPLFICGPPGVGKTHLMHSIAGLLSDHNPGLVLRYATGESFTNDFRLALGGGQMDGFKARFRHADVLLIDDVQFLERKAKTEEEFFHTFNALHEAGAQIVLTSDRPPRDLQALEDRLRERFEAGLVADIQAPDYTTRLAILRKRVLQDQIELASERLLETVARRVVENVRALEGALIRVVAYGSLTGRELSNDLAEEVLAGLYPQAPRRPCSVAEIQAFACKHFELTSEELLSSSRTARVAWPRQVAMYLARELTDESLPVIARHFGGRDHTTVLHAWRRTTQRLAEDSRSRQAVDNLRQLIEVGDS